MMTRYKAYATAGLASESLPIIPPNAPIHPKSSEGVAAGRGKIPGYKTRDGWKGLQGWPQHVGTPEDLSIWAGWGANLGMQGRMHPAVDIDVDDAELSAAIRKLALDTFGGAPTRYGNGARCLLVYAAKGMKKRRVAFVHRDGNDQSGATAPSTPHQAVEFLATGQQYVVEGMHPKAGKPYCWLDDRSPATIGATGLTAIAAEQVDQFFTDLEGLLELHGYQVVSSSAATPDHWSGDLSQLAPSLDAIKAALNAIENTVDYDTWITIISAVKTAAGPDREAEAFLASAAWSLTYPGNTPKDFTAKWASFREPRAGWGFLRRYAIEHGDGTFCDAAEEFDAVAPTPTADELAEAADAKPLTAMFDRYVWVESVGLIADTKTGVLLNREKFNVRNRHIGPPNKADTCAYAVLTSSVPRLQVAHAITYRPGAERFVDENLPGLTGRCINLWKPSAIELPHHVSDADVQPWLEHVAFVIPDENERTVVLNWLAWIIQHQGEKPNWALVIGSTKEGIGKDFMMQPVRVALGADNVREIGPDDIASGYSDFLVGTRLLIVEEMQMHERKALMNRLKPIIASPPYTLRVNIKFVPQYEIPNLVAAVFFTNMENALAIGPHDRRYFVTWNDQAPRSAPYYAELAAWYESGGAAAAAAWLSMRDLSGFNAKGRAPDSEAKSAMRMASRSLFDETVEDAVANKEGPFAHGLFTLDEAVAYIEPRLGDRQRLSPRRLSGALKRLGVHTICRMSLGAEPPGSTAPYLKEAPMHQVLSWSEGAADHESASIRAAFWAERAADHQAAANPDTMFQ